MDTLRKHNKAVKHMFYTPEKVAIISFATHISLLLHSVKETNKTGNKLVLIININFIHNSDHLLLVNI